MNDQVIIITGCASGIGQHLARVLAGHKLIATDINIAGQASELHHLDVRDPAGWSEIIALAVEKWGRLDVLINVAGVIHPAYVKDITPQQIDLQLDVNVKGTMLGTQAAAAQMVKQGHGQIINISSLAGLSAVPGMGVYAASKFAVRGFSLSAAYELRPHGVYVTTIYPDAVQTPMLDSEIGHDEAALTFSGSRILTVQDVENAVHRALRHKPMEISLPRTRGWLAKLASLLPTAAAWIEPILIKQGRQKQAKIRKERGS